MRVRSGRQKAKAGGQVVRLPGLRRRGPQRGGRRWLWWTVLISAVIAGVGMGLTWRVDEIRVTGLGTLPAESVVHASGVEGGDLMILLRPRRVADRVENIPAVRTASVTRSLRGAVIVGVVERTPLVRLDADHGLGVDAQGRVFPVHPELPLPLLGGWQGRAEAGAAVDPLSRQILHAYARFPGSLRTVTLAVHSGERLMLTLAGGIQVRFGELRDLEAKARAAASVLDIAAERGESLEYVDVRTPSSPVAKKPDSAAGNDEDDDDD